MNFNLLLIAISFLGLLLFWLLYRTSNSSQKLTQKHLISRLKNKTISSEQRTTYESQLSDILQNSSQSHASFKILIFVAIVVIPLSFLFYHKLGTPSAVDYNPQPSKLNTQQSEQASQMSMQDAIQKLEERLAKTPDDVDGQMLYARSLMSLKRYQEAVTAYKKSMQLAPNEAVILTELAEAIALANNNRSFLGEPEELLAKAVELDPDNQKAVWLLGMTFYEHQDFAKTNELWSKLFEMMSDEGAKKQLEQQINEIRNKLGLEALTVNPTPIISDDQSSLQIKITLADHLKSNLSGKPALLYVYSKEVAGMPMPIAVLRQPLEQIVKNFPIEVIMNDGHSLQPQRKLSGFNKVKIGVRISFTGNATAQTGDLQSEELIIELPSEKIVELVIDTVRQ